MPTNSDFPLSICTTCGAIDLLRGESGECGKCAHIRDPAQRRLHMFFARLLNGRRPIARTIVSSLIFIAMFGALAATVFLFHHVVLLHRFDGLLGEVRQGAALGGLVGLLLSIGGNVYWYKTKYLPWLSQDRQRT
jgi:hypothetical protein